MFAKTSTGQGMENTAWEKQKFPAENLEKQIGEKLL